MMNCTVLYEGWQMQCCGEPFSVGDIVEWTVFSFSKAPLGVDQKIDYIYDAHYETDKGLYILQGTVCQIDALFTKYRPSAHNSKFQIPVSGFLKRVECADGDDEDTSGASFDSYLIVLKDINIKQAIGNHSYD